MEYHDSYNQSSERRDRSLAKRKQMRAGQGHLFHGFVDEAIREGHRRNPPTPPNEWSKMEVSLEREENAVHVWIHLKTVRGDIRERFCTLPYTRMSAALLGLLHEIEDMDPRNEIKGL